MILAQSSIGTINYKLKKSEIKNKIFKRSLFVVKDIKKDEKFTKNNLKAIRPSYGLHPKFYHKIIGKISKSNIIAGERMKWSLIKK